MSALLSAPTTRIPAWVRLVRLPNLFTAIADPLAGWFVVGISTGAPAWALLPLLGASAGLYAGGIVVNDVGDYSVDCAERPDRPLPRGDISRRAAARLGALLLGGGVILASAAGLRTLGIAAALALLILLYNWRAKRSAVAGPVVLGVCRAGNLLLGMGGMPGRLWWMPVGLGLYVAGLALIARQETIQPAVRGLVTRLLLGIILLDAVFVASQGDLTGALLVAGLIVPAAVLRKWIPMT